MDKRYQVFISSTFQDLQEARNAVLQSLLRMRHIPAGMELFPAIDEEQMLYIRKVIDESDYYLLVIGGRYGSLSAKGVSYTEDEYAYAVKTGKPVLAFIHENPENLPAKDTERDPALQEKLKAFCEKVKTGGRIVRFWHDVKDLRAEVAESLPQTITARPAIGWVRADKVSSLEQENALRKERDSLKAENEKLKAKLGQNTAITDIAGLDDKAEIKVKYEQDFVMVKNILFPSWKEIFLEIAPDMEFESRTELEIEDILEEFFEDFCSKNNIKNITISEKSFLSIRMTLKALGLISYDSERWNDSININWSLTQKGEKVLYQSFVARKSRAET